MTGQILISKETYALIKNDIVCEKKDEIKVKGIAHKIQTYQVLAPYGTLAQKRKLLSKKFDGFNLNIDLNISKKSKVINSLEEILEKLKKLIRENNMNNFKERDFFHEGMRHYQDLFDGRRTAEAIKKNRKHYEFWDDEKNLIKNSKFFFISSSWNDYIDCNIKSGDPGFVKIIDKGTIEYPEYDGNSMYRTAGNIFKNPNVGLLFISFDGESRRIKINGIASIHHDQETVKNHFGAKFVIRVKCEIYPNCPRYIPNGNTKTPSIYVPREGHEAPPAPEWKERDYIKYILPEGDPHKK